MRRCGVRPPPPPPPPIIFERLTLLQQIIYRRKENLSESPNHLKYRQNILISHLNLPSFIYYFVHMIYVNHRHSPKKNGLSFRNIGFTKYFLNHYLPCCDPYFQFSDPYFYLFHQWVISYLDEVFLW